MRDAIGQVFTLPSREVVVPHRPQMFIYSDDASLATAGGSTTVRADVVDGVGGEIEWFERAIGDPEWIPLGRTPLDDQGHTSLVVDVAAGGSEFKGVYAPAAGAEASEDVQPRVTVVDAKYPVNLAVDVSPLPVTVNETDVEIFVAATYGDECQVGFLTVTDTFQGSARDLSPEIADCYFDLSTRFASVGMHRLEINFAGNDVVAAVSRVVDLNVQPDTAVKAIGVGRSAATVYPYKDGYRDTVTIRGTRLESAGVSIRIYNGSNHLARSLAAATADGDYAVKWNGRKADGTRVAAGRYRIVQTILDRAGNKRAYTSYVTVSSKKLHWYTGSVTKTGEAFTSSDHTALGSISRGQSVYATGVRLQADMYGQWAQAGWDFRLPSATKYGRLDAAVLSRTPSGHGPAYMAINGMNSRWMNTSYGWTKATGGADQVAGRWASVWVAVAGDDQSSAQDVKSVRLTYRYARLVS